LINILSTEYSLRDRALDIAVAGCNPPHCPGCFNPESWDHIQGTPLSQEFPLITKLIRESWMVKNIRDRKSVV
jgi:pyruvate-formate lyase-activating enzyme